MFYYITMYFRYEFEDGTHAMTISEYALNSYLGEEEYNALVDLNRKTAEATFNKNVVDCYTISKEEYDAEDAKELEVNVVYERDDD